MLQQSPNISVFEFWRSNLSKIGFALWKFQLWLNQCCGSGMLYSGSESSYKFFKFPDPFLSILLKHIEKRKKLKINQKEEYTIYQVSAIFYFSIQSCSLQSRIHRPDPDLQHWNKWAVYNAGGVWSGVPTCTASPSARTASTSPSHPTPRPFTYSGHFLTLWFKRCFGSGSKLYVYVFTILDLCGSGSTQTQVNIG